jgi:hypothetical protein
LYPLVRNSRKYKKFRNLRLRTPAAYLYAEISD